MHQKHQSCCFLPDILIFSLFQFYVSREMLSQDVKLIDFDILVYHEMIEEHKFVRQNKRNFDCPDC